ncbi:hypothetical protein BpHYR1_021296 [Brachionus plicatilis]|uniref:Uncharacterized protein n=1 Tax=Brachionus plicatilis TaxID=10195 RepID=A0A3M7SDP6_BRAPC|nr:hypothetical protein BpHYR1_021296 [Brachionus plicatilis]
MKVVLPWPRGPDTTQICFCLAIGAGVNVLDKFRCLSLRISRKSSFSSSRSASKLYMLKSSMVSFLNSCDASSLKLTLVD